MPQREFLTPQNKSQPFFDFGSKQQIVKEDKTRMRKFDVSAMKSTKCSTILPGQGPSEISQIAPASKRITKKKELISDAWLKKHLKILRCAGHLMCA